MTPEDEKMIITSVVDDASRYIDYWRDETGAIPLKVIPRMKHHLAHCYMSMVCCFLKHYGLRNPGDFEDMREFALDKGWKSRYENG